MNDPGFFGIPTDNTHLLEVTRTLLGLASDQAPLGFSAAIQLEDLDGLSRLWAYWSMLLIGMQKASDPVERGITLDEVDVKSMSKLCHMHAPSAAIAKRTYFYIDRITQEDYASVKVWLSQLCAVPDWRSIEFHFWTLAQSIQYLRIGSMAHSKFLVKVAMLRLMLYQALKIVRTHEWCDADLGAAADIGAILNDQGVQAPGDNRV